MHIMRVQGTPLETGLTRFIDTLPERITMAEIGCYSGEATLRFLKKASKVYCVDPWRNYGEHNEGSTIIINDMAEAEMMFDKLAAIFKDRIVKTKGYSLAMAEKFADGFFDMVYIDANHEYEAVKMDIEAWLPKVKQGGILAGHDYDNESRTGVRQAVEKIFGHPDAVYEDSTWSKRIGAVERVLVPRHFAWMRTGAEQIAGLNALIADLPDQCVMAEIGCYAGEATAMFAKKASRIYAVDPWQEFMVPMTDGRGVDTGAGGHLMVMREAEIEFDKTAALYPDIIRKLKGSSVEMARFIPNRVLDAVYIDADHTYEHVVEDLKTWLPKIKHGGIICGHDYTYIYDVQRAVDEVIGTPHKVYEDSSWLKPVLK